LVALFGISLLWEVEPALGFRQVGHHLLAVGAVALGAGMTTSVWVLARSPWRKLDALILRILSETIPASWPPAERRRHRLRDALCFASVYLPAKPPAGWSQPLCPLGCNAWMVRAAGEELLVSMDLRGNAAHVRVIISPPPGQTQPVSDMRCAEILANLPNVVTWAEAELEENQTNLPRSTHRAARIWLGAPCAPLRRRGAPPVPGVADVPSPNLPPLSDLLVEVRRHLPDKLPDGWSIPVANPAEDVWLYEVDHLTAIVGFCSTENGVKLHVALIASPEDQVTETFALRVLKRFRDVGEFVALPCGEEPQIRTYLGELTAGAYAAVGKRTAKRLN
jgi:hypothetical protein